MVVAQPTFSINLNQIATMLLSCDWDSFRQVHRRCKCGVAHRQKLNEAQKICISQVDTQTARSLGANPPKNIIQCHHIADKTSTKSLHWPEFRKSSKVSSMDWILKKPYYDCISLNSHVTCTPKLLCTRERGGIVVRDEAMSLRIAAWTNNYPSCIVFVPKMAFIL